MIRVQNNADSTDIYVVGDIVDDSWKGWSWGEDMDTYPSDIRDMLSEANNKAVNVYINSGGGDLFAGVAISNMLKRHNASTKAIVDGLAGSAASIIAFGCDTIEMPENAYLMIHKPSSWCSGNADDFKKMADTLDTLQEGIVNMLLSAEIRRKIENKKAEMKNLRDKGEIEKAHAMIGEIENLNKELEIQLKIEEDEKNSVVNNPSTAVVSDKVDENRAFNKALMNKSMNEAEKSYVESNLVENKAGTPGVIGADDARGGYLLPATHETQIKELRRKRRALKELVNVKYVTTRTGKFNTEGENALELLNFEELNTLTAKDLKFAQKVWAVKDYGLLIPVANQFIEDTDVNIVDYIGKEFVKASVRTENKAIITEFKKLEATTIKGVDGLLDALNVTLNPAIAENAKIITNQTSFNYLDKLEDKQGRKLLQPCLADPTKMMLRNKVIEVFADEELTPKTPENLTFYVGDAEEYLNFYEKKGIEVVTSAEAGFKEYATWLRVVERFDVGVVDDKALVLCEMPKPV